MFSNEVLLITAFLLVLSVLLNKIGGKFGVPSLLIFILVGILAGTDGIGGIYFENYDLANFIGMIAISFILFMGGLSIKPSELKPVFVEGAVLATAGVFITGIILGLCCYLFLDLTILECILLGSIISSTDAAAVFSVLRSKSISLGHNLKPLLEFESGSNDPMAMLLTMASIGLITATLSVKSLIIYFFMQMLLGIVFGIVIGKGTAFLINKIRLESDSLYVIITIACVLFTYSFVTIIGGSGLLACYVCGLAMAYTKFVNKKSLTRFHDSIAWLMQIVMFLILGLLVNPLESLHFIWQSFLAAVVLIFIARPVAVFLTTIPFKRGLNEKLMISWVGLRGAAPIVLATFPMTNNIPHADEIFMIIFWCVIISVIVQGTTIPLFAKLLKVDAPLEVDHSAVIDYEAKDTNNKMFEFKVPVDSAAAGKKLMELGLPENSLINLIYKNGEYIIPKGNTIIEAEDVLFMLVDIGNEEAVKDIFAARTDDHKPDEPFATDITEPESSGDDSDAGMEEGRFSI